MAILVVVDIGEGNIAHFECKYDVGASSIYPRPIYDAPDISYYNGGALDPQ